MKKNIFNINLLLCFLLFLSSCKQNDFVDKSQDQEKISILNNDLKQLNSQFFSKKNLNKKASKPGNQVPPAEDPKPITDGISFKKLCAVFSNDVAGAWAGVWAGGKIGALAGTVTVPGIGTVSGATAGAVAGGVIVGAAASYGASSSIPDTTLRNVPLLNTPLAQPLSEESPYDGHNRILATLISSSSVPSSEVPLPVNEGAATPAENTTKIFDNVYLTANENIIVSNCENLISTTLNTFSNVEPSVSVSKSYVNNVIDDNYLTTVSNNFFEGISQFSEKGQILEYIDSYEQYVKNTSNLSATQKQSIIIALDASRGSLDFWSPISK